MITKNVGNVDRVIRLVAGLALAFGAYRASGPAVYVLYAASGIAVLTGLVGWCGLYTLLGVNTCRIDKP
jgi:hypothetical protein